MLLVTTMDPLSGPGDCAIKCLPTRTVLIQPFRLVSNADQSGSGGNAPDGPDAEYQLPRSKMPALAKTKSSRWPPASKAALNAPARSS